MIAYEMQNETRPIQYQAALNDVQENGLIRTSLAIVHGDESLSAFGDEDALLSLAPTAVEVTKTSDDSTATTANQSIKPSELRQTSDEPRIKFDDDGSASYGTDKMTLNFDAMGLIGREKQVSTLKACFDRLSDSSVEDREPSDSHQDNPPTPIKELVLVVGESGSGKTSTVQTLEDQMLEEKVGMFVKGKFEMNTTDEPYSGIAKAVSAMCLRISGGDERQAAGVRESISKSIHEDEAQLLVHLIPELAHIISADLKGAAVEREMDVDDDFDGGMERLKHAFRSLIRSFCNHCAPLVLFLDDLQFADISSLQIIDSLLSDTENESSLMIIGTYRSEEIDENSLLYVKLLAIEGKSSMYNFHITQVDLPNFDANDVASITKAIFSSVDDEENNLLAEVCVKRTLGNPYFVFEFIKMLYREGLFQYINAAKSWTWNIGKIENATMSTANVAVLLQDRMRRLSKYARMFLHSAAYLGSTFSMQAVDLVWRLLEMPMDVGGTPILPLLMKKAVQDRFMEECGSNKYRWVHDKVQEAALSLMEETKVSRFDIGKTLYRSLQSDPRQLDQDLFAVVDLINSGDTEKGTEFARANLKAAEKAIGLSAFKSAASYASHGIALLEGTGWYTDRELKLRLYTIGTDAELILGNAETVERYIEEVLDRGGFTVMETLSLIMAKIKFLASVQLRYNDAVDTCLRTLNHLDCKVLRSRRLLKIEALNAVRKTVKKLKKVPSDFHERVGVITDPKQKGIATLIGSLSSAAFSANFVMLGILACCKVVDMTLKFGVSEGSGESFATIGAAVLFYKQDYETAQRLMELALDIQEVSGRARSSKTTRFAYVFGLAWTQKMHLCLPKLSSAYDVGMATGETVAALWSLVSARALIPFAIGRPLQLLQHDTSRILAQAEDVAQPAPAEVARKILQMIVNLSVPSVSQPTLLEGEVCDPAVHKSKDNIYGRTTRHLAKMSLLLFFSDYEAAGALALEKGDLFPKLLPGNCTIMCDVFHRAIALYAAASRTKQKKFKKAARKLHKRIAGWEKLGNPNVKHCVLALDAESAALNNKRERAMAKYRQAIAAASEDGYLQYKALFSERFADYLSQYPSSAEEAKRIRQEAIRAYSEWGAHAKVAQLEAGERLSC